MFTGIIQAIGKINAIEPHGGDVRLRIDAGALDLGDVTPGDSIAVNGVCLTVIDRDTSRFSVDVSGETLAHTTLREFGIGEQVNLEKALMLSSRLGGHLVSGHVDGVGEVLERRTDGRSVRFRVRVPEPLAKYIAAKGSVCMDGVSLTVNAIDGAVFDLNIVPHTLTVTTLHDCKPGQRVNIEIDLVARYVESLMRGGQAVPASSTLSRELLKENGFIR